LYGSIIQSQKKTVDGVYNMFVASLPTAPKIKTFRQWISTGTKFANLAGAGKHFFFNTGFIIITFNSTLIIF
jgi:hypothetical protein